MYPKNAASPEPIAIGPVVQISDGAVQTSGCTVRIKPIGVAEGDGAGTTAYSTDGVVLYTPTQAETNYTSFVLIAKKTGCIPANITIVTTSSATPGTVLLAPVTHTSAVVPTVTTLTNLPAITTNWLTATGIAADAITAAKIADGAIDNATLAVDTGLRTTRSSTLQSATASTAVLDASASSTTDLYTGLWLKIIANTGVGQVRLITAYNGTSKACTVHRNWATTPDNTSQYAILAAGDIYGVVLADTLTTYTGDTPQTGDAYAVVNSGTHGNAALKTLIDAISSYLSTNLGLLGANLSAIPKTGFKLASDGLAAVVSWAVAITGNITGNLSGSVGSVTGLTVANLDVAVSTRMATYAQPTGFLAATFPSDPADQSLIVDATNALATLIGDVPTNAELTTALGTSDDAMLAAIAAVDTVVDQILALLNDDAAEPGTGALPATASRMEKIDAIHKILRNKASQSSDQQLIYDATGATPHHKRSVVVSSGVVTLGEIGAP
jgi:hypothetical protein